MYLSDFIQLKNSVDDNSIIEVHQIMKNRKIKVRYEDLQYISLQLKNLIEPNISHPSVYQDQFSLQSFIVTEGLAAGTFIVMNKHDYTSFVRLRCSIHDSIYEYVLYEHSFSRIIIKNIRFEHV